MDIKHLMKSGLKFAFDSDYRFSILAAKGLYNNMPDEKYLKRLYRAKFGKELDLDNPQTLSGKLQWLKLYYRRPDYTMMADKYAVRPYVAEKIGEEHLVPLLGVWDDPEDIDFDALPEQFVLKCNHNSGIGLCVCKDKSKLDIENVRSELRKGLAEDFSLITREQQYKNIPRKIIAEKYMKDDVQNEKTGIVNYKFYCFNGEPKFLFVSLNTKGKKNDFLTFLTLDWQLAPFGFRDYVADFDQIPPKPASFDKMLECARALSSDLPFVRVDLYQIDGQVYFSELTLIASSGFLAYKPEGTDELFGSWLKLPPKWKED